MSLNEAARRAELDEENARKDQREKDRLSRVKEKDPRVYRVTLDNASKKDLVPVKFVEPKPPKDSGSTPEEEEAPPNDTITEPQIDKEGKPMFKSAPIRLDPVKQESLNILGDLVELTKMDGTTTARHK